jgi:hypothetical protein
MVLRAFLKVDLGERWGSISVDAQRERERERQPEKANENIKNNNERPPLGLIQHSLAR